MNAPKKTAPAKDDAVTPTKDDTTAKADDTTTTDDTVTEPSIVEDSRFDNLERVLAAVVTDIAKSKGVSAEQYVATLLPEEDSEDDE